MAETHETIETQAGLGIALLDQGDGPQALECAEKFLDHITRHGVEGFEEPVKDFLGCTRILSATQDPRAAGILHQGYALLQEIASKIEPEEKRLTFLERIPENRALVEAWNRSAADSPIL